VASRRGCQLSGTPPDVPSSKLLSVQGKVLELALKVGLVSVSWWLPVL
jgi:hypothetical protein